MTTPTLDQLDWKKGDGLLPAVVQDADTLQVLMLGYMNAEALRQTLATKRVTFFSRSKNRLWTKGETSGHFLDLVDAAADCDNDAILIKARPHGPTCHRGTTSCFGDRGASGVGFLAHLDQVVAGRLAGGDEKSYTVRLAREGVNRVAQKVGEEGVETALAAATGTNEQLAGEAADLLYHLIVLLQVKKLNLGEALSVLEARHRK
ncbi:MAG: bifunctional phosphoribosyl-AMP cyclohydrolase/phosphoribosyl-ATP diphosphatase HisIE [Opitutaceae bacterium]|nr:bifunctional phosphoribosyl-AMP cyclohydrolase/phosphoribosyl-ATP diphosphatase HisIE [Opitutaceae bacterium]